MSKRSAIITKTDSGYAGIYCHSDGYIDGVGKTLLNHYLDAEKVNSLIALGDISYLSERVTPIGKHDWNNPEDGTTMAYMRDRGETGCKFKTGETVQDVEKKIDHNGYVYVFEDGNWTVNGDDLFEAYEREQN